MDVKGLSGFFIWVMTVIAGAVGIAFQTRSNTKKILEFDSRIASMDDAFKKKLFLDNGESIYMPRHSCNDCRIQCQIDRHKIYEELKITNSELKSDIKQVRAEVMMLSERFHELSGAVNEFMEANRPH